jgi:hypothetical protein
VSDDTHEKTLLGTTLPVASFAVAENRVVDPIAVRVGVEDGDIVTLATAVFVVNCAALETAPAVFTETLMTPTFRTAVDGTVTTI